MKAHLPTDRVTSQVGAKLTQVRQVDQLVYDFNNMFTTLIARNNFCTE